VGVCWRRSQAPLSLFVRADGELRSCGVECRDEDTYGMGVANVSAIYMHVLAVTYKEKSNPGASRSTPWLLGTARARKATLPLACSLSASRRCVA
jgi:hypothetical protein